jgi:hypothetical protein
MKEANKEAGGERERMERNNRSQQIRIRNKRILPSLTKKFAKYC